MKQELKSCEKVQQVICYYSKDVDPFLEERICREFEEPDTSEPDPYSNDDIRDPDYEEGDDTGSVVNASDENEQNLKPKLYQVMTNGMRMSHIPDVSFHYYSLK